jgi:tetratricopeptide (TPR) repeat protein
MSRQFWAWSAAAAFLIMAFGARPSPAANVAAEDKPVQPEKPAEPPKPTALSPAKLLPGISPLHHPITTSSPEAQAFYDQGLGFQHSFVYMEAARSFERATQLDPSCAMAFWGLSRALESWGRGDEAQAALRWAKQLSESASDREQRLIEARVLEKEAGRLKDGAREEKMKQVRRTLDELLALYPEDDETWMQRAAVAEGGSTGAIPFYKACLLVNPRHPGAHHQLVHAYEGIGRPALGWPHSQGYVDNAPLVPHSHHMQVHLAMRLSRWDVASANMLRSLALERMYHQEMKVDPRQDQQFLHHMDIATRALVHNGNYHMAREIKKEAQGLGWNLWNIWARLHQAEHDWVELLRLGEEAKKKGDASAGGYITALACLGAGDLERARAEVEALEKEREAKKNNRELEYRTAEVRGLLDLRTGKVDEGLRVIRQAAERSKTDYGYHAYGGGAYLLEAWGQAALAGNRADEAEEAFLEALAHDTHSAVAALGLRAICSDQNRKEEAERYTELAHRIWKEADPQVLEAEVAYLAVRLPASTARAAQPAGTAAATGR